MTDERLVQTQVQERRARHRGALKSADWNDFVDETVHDITQLGAAINSLNSRLTRSMVILQHENDELRRHVDALLSQKQYSEKVAGGNNFLVSRFLDLNETEGISFLNGLDDTFSAMVSADYGEATLPANAVESKFYYQSLRTGKILTPADLVVEVTGTFDKADGAGLVDYERGGSISEGKPEWAFNGINHLYWVRRVEFPLDSRVDQVECQLTVTVPAGSSREANLVEVVPFPNGSLDVTSLATAADLGTVFTTVPGFESTDNLSARRYHFPAVPVDQVRIRLRQRNWVEENGKKVFYYGLQELGLKLVDYDKRYTPGASLGSNHAFVLQFNAPAGYAFKDIYRIDPDPSFLLEDLGKRHVHLRLVSDPTSGTTLWDSDTTLAPQLTGVAIPTMGRSTLYWVVELNYVESTGGASSPFLVGTTPCVRGIGTSFTLQEL